MIMIKSWQLSIEVLVSCKQLLNSTKEAYIYYTVLKAYSY